MQNLANEQTFTDKEPYMTYFDRFISEFTLPIKRFFERLVNLPGEETYTRPSILQGHIVEDMALVQISSTISSLKDKLIHEFPTAVADSHGSRSSLLKARKALFSIIEEVDHSFCKLTLLDEIIMHRCKSELAKWLVNRNDQIAKDRESRRLMRMHSVKFHQEQFNAYKKDKKHHKLHLGFSNLSEDSDLGSPKRKSKRMSGRFAFLMGDSQKKDITTKHKSVRKSADMGKLKAFIFGDIYDPKPPKTDARTKARRRHSADAKKLFGLKAKAISFGEPSATSESSLPKRDRSLTAIHPRSLHVSDPSAASPSTKSPKALRKLASAEARSGYKALRKKLSSSDDANDM